MRGYVERSCEDGAQIQEVVVSVKTEASLLPRVQGLTISAVFGTVCLRQGWGSSCRPNTNKLTRVPVLFCCVSPRSDRTPAWVTKRFLRRRHRPALRRGRCLADCAAVTVCSSQRWMSKSTPNLQWESKVLQQYATDDLLFWLRIDAYSRSDLSRVS